MDPAPCADHALGPPHDRDGPPGLGVGAKIIGEIVGHQSEAATRRYQHVSSAAAREAMDRLGSHFSLQP